MCATTTKYVFSGSKVVAEYANGALAKEYVHAGSQLLATVAADGTPTYHHGDHLSTRTDTDAAGHQIRSYGHFPFGETWYEDASVGKWKFTSYERDGESGLDYAMFRYDSTRLGRFMSPDPLAGSIANPQSLNRYSYVANDPINLVDPLGLIINPPAPPPPGPGPYIGFDDGKGPFDCGYMGLPTNCGSHRPMSAELGMGRGGGGGKSKGQKEKKEERECFAQLKSRAVNDPLANSVGGTHSFWYVQGSTGTQYIISAGPNPPEGENRTLNIFTPNADIHGGVDNVSAHTSYDSGLSSKNCKGVDAMLAAANAFPNNSIPYSWFWGPNSNSAANYLGQQGGLSPSAPHGSWGWGVPIPPPQP